jgi:hypothetical protein
MAKTSKRLTGSQVGTGGFMHQDGAASSHNEDGVSSSSSLAPSLVAGFFFC